MERETLCANIQGVRERIARAAARSGRPPEAVRLMAVTKTLPLEHALLALAEGITLFGENRVQEAADKWTSLPQGAELHLIGHLQRNKARAAARTFSCVQSIDKVETAEELSKACLAAGRECEILLEVNTSGELTKSGVAGGPELRELLPRVAELPALRVRGLMTVGPLTEDPVAIRKAFALLRSCFEDARRAFPSCDTISMGMSGDFEAAVEEGSTLVRIGTALFGARQAAWR